jgi:hypothetical protein
MFNITTIDAAAPSFSLTLPETNTYYTRTLDVRAVNTTNDVDQAWFRYNNGSWSANVSMTYDSGNGWWEYESAANYWNEDDYQLQVFMNQTGTGDEGMDSATFTIDVTPTYTYVHPINREYTDTKAPIEYTTVGAASYTWNLHDGATWVYASNQTGAFATELEWSMTYSLYAYAQDGAGTWVVDSSQMFSTSSQQGGAVAIGITTATTTDPATEGEGSGIQLIADNPLLVLVIAGIAYAMISRRKE